MIGNKTPGTVTPAPSITIHPALYWEPSGDMMNAKMSTESGEYMLTVRQRYNGQDVNNVARYDWGWEIGPSDLRGPITHKSGKRSFDRWIEAAVSAEAALEKLKAGAKRV